MKSTEPSLDEWRALYAAAVEFRKIEPWLWMKETDIFGVSNRQDGHVGYCCIMGEIGQLFGMAVYRGTEGLQGHDRIRKGEVKPGDPESLYIQDALLVSFDDREDLEKEDRQLIKDLGLKFRGRNSWPVFRDHKPGYFPWFLDRDGMLWMTDALHQATEVSLRARVNEQLLKLPKKGLYLVRVPVIKGSAVDWKDEWREPAPVHIEEAVQVGVDEIRIQRLQKVAKSSPVKWEIDFFYAPAPIAGGGRPYFPYAIMIVEHDSGFIRSVQLAQIGQHETAFIRELLSCIEQSSMIPEEILLRKEEAARLFEPYTSRLNIKLSLGGKLKYLDKARRDLEKHLGIG